MQENHGNKRAYEQPGKLILITGARGAGKTRACRQLAQNQSVWDLRGLLSTPLVSDEEKVGINLLDLSTGQSRHLATRANNLNDSTASLTMGCWGFVPSTFAWGNHVLQSISNSGILIIDELGPLEFQQQSGLVEALSLVTERNYDCAFVVVRPSLIDAALQLWPWGEVVEISSSPDLLVFLKEVVRD